MPIALICHINYHIFVRIFSLIGLLLFPVWLLGGELRHCYATWEDDPTHSIALHFHGENTRSELTLYYDCEPHHSVLDKYRSKISVPLYKTVVRNLYHVNLSNLEPNTTYYFTLAEGRHPLGPERSFRTLSEEPPYRMIEAGDWENTKAALTLAQLAATYTPDAVWLGGDYPTGVISKHDYFLWDEWLDTYTHTLVGEGGRLIPFVMAIGNHEVVGGFGQSKKQAPFFFDYFRPHQESYFAFRIGKQVKLLVLDSGHATRHSGDQVIWLEKELQTKAPLTMALYHVPLYPSVRFTEKTFSYKLLAQTLQAVGIRGADRRLFSAPSLWGQRHWLPVFDTYGLKLAFEHHDQALKRTHPLKGGKRDPNGTIYLGDGGFGPEKQVTPVKGYGDARFAKVRGKIPFFWLIDISGGKVICRAITYGGVEVDSLSLDW